MMKPIETKSNDNADQPPFKTNVEEIFYLEMYEKVRDEKNWNYLVKYDFSLDQFVDLINDYGIAINNYSETTKKIILDKLFKYEYSDKINTILHNSILTFDIFLYLSKLNKITVNDIDQIALKHRYVEGVNPFIELKNFFPSFLRGKKLDCSDESIYYFFIELIKTDDDKLKEIAFNQIFSQQSKVSINNLINLIDYDKQYTKPLLNIILKRLDSNETIIKIGKDNIVKLINKTRSFNSLEYKFLVEILLNNFNELKIDNRDYFLILKRIGLDKDVLRYGLNNLKFDSDEIIKLIILIKSMGDDDNFKNTRMMSSNVYDDIVSKLFTKLDNLNVKNEDLIFLYSNIKNKESIWSHIKGIDWSVYEIILLLSADQSVDDRNRITKTLRTDTKKLERFRKIKKMYAEVDKKYLSYLINYENNTDILSKSHLNKIKHLNKIINNF